MNNMIDKIKKEYNEIIVWLKANPKTFFKYSLIILIASFCISLLQFFLFPSKEIYKYKFRHYILKVAISNKMR